jgi:hypothetical protein
MKSEATNKRIISQCIFRNGSDLPNPGRADVVPGEACRKAKNKGVDSPRIGCTPCLRAPESQRFGLISARESATNQLKILQTQLKPQPQRPELPNIRPANSVPVTVFPGQPEVGGFPGIREPRSVGGSRVSKFFMLFCESQRTGIFTAHRHGVL